MEPESPSPESSQPPTNTGIPHIPPSSIGIPQKRTIKLVDNAGLTEMLCALEDQSRIVGVTVYAPLMGAESVVEQNPPGNYLHVSSPTHDLNDFTQMW